MKRGLLILCTVALMLGMIVSWNVYATEEEAVCQYCGRAESQWIELTNDTDRFLVAGHYYLTADVTRDKQLVLEAEGISCVDLASHTLLGEGRAFQIGEDAATPNVVLNIYDSVGGGAVKGKGSTNTAWSGGTIWLEPGATINLYSGTLTTYDTAAQSAGKGAVAIIKGTMNVYGGSVIGGTAYTYGGALWVASGGALNLAGGMVTGGTAPTGACVYAHSASSVSLSGNAKVDDLAFTDGSADCLTVSGTYTGTAQLTLGEIASGTTIASADNADISGATLTVAGSTLTPMVSGDSIIVGEGSWCEACQRNVVWTSVTDAHMDSITVFSAGHYRLTENVTTTQMSLKNMSGTICLDLNGFSYTSSGRAFLLENAADSTVNNGLNIMDSSENETGVLVGMGGSEAMASGVIRTYKNTVLNIYSGTLRLDDGGSVAAKDGGVMQLSGEANMYGGTLVGGKVARWGGAVSVGSGAVFTMTGGTIEPGSAATAADCVYIASGGKMKLSGDASPRQICFADASIGNITVTGSYTGNTEFAFITLPAAGADVGDCVDAVIPNEAITVSGSRMVAKASGADLVLGTQTGAAVLNTDGTATYFDTLAAALAAGNNIKLLSDNAENVTVNADVTLDLNGWDMSGNITVTGGTLLLKDSCTDDHTVEDVEGYGIISGTVTGNAKAAEGYLKLTETAGISFHHYVLKLSKVNLRPGCTGIYYSSDILLDEAVLAQVDRFGITVSTGTALPTADAADTKSLYTAYTKDQYADGNASSVLISNIMDGENTDAVDAATAIYGRPYICLADGTYLYGTVYSTDLQTLTELIDSTLWTKLGLQQNRAYSAMYDTYKTAMESWKLDNVSKSAADAKSAADDGVFKAIIIGNSDSTDATNLLYEIFLAEGWTKDQLVLGCMYESGCGIVSHVKFALNNMPEYKYYKNTGANADGTWDCTENSTLEYALQDENWDVVILQESNTVSGIASTYQNDDIETLITYVVNTLGYEPKLLWHFVGANPEIPQAYVDYVNSLDNADGDNSDASENEGWEDTGVEEPEDLVWIFDLARPSAPVAWAKRYMQYWNNDREVMYNAISYNVRKYIMGSDLYGFDGVIPSATTFQHAINTLGMTEQDMYRDYTHKSDYGRVMVSYMWYVALTGRTEPLTEIKFTTVPAAIRHKKFVQYGDLVLTDEQIDVLIKSVNHAMETPYDAPIAVGKEGLDGKKVIFFGNSHTYYGKTVIDQGQSFNMEDRVDDQGIFYQLCKANGIDVSVTNYTFGVHELADFYSGSCAAGKHDGHNHLEDITDYNYDYVILQQGTKDDANDLVGDVQAMMDLFTPHNPNVKFIFMVHKLPYTRDYGWLTKVKELEELGVTVVDWGGMLEGIVTGEITVPDSTVTYTDNSFIISQSASDGYHPNILTGYITSLMTYCAITGEEAQGQPFNFGTDCSVTGDSALATYRSKYYKYNTETNFDTIFRSETEMAALQKLIDQYMKAKSFRHYE